MDDDGDRSTALDFDSPDALQQVDQTWHDAHLRYIHTGTVEAEREAFQALVPLLTAAAKELHEHSRGSLIWAPMGLAYLANVLQDRLDGWGWRSLATRRKGPGTNHLQRDAMGYAWAYIEAARRKQIADPDPMGSVRKAYGPAPNTPLTERTVYRWRTEHQLPPSKWFKSYFDGRIEDPTERARRALKSFGKSYQRRPSDTSPVE